MWISASLLLAFAGWAGLALAMSKHRAQLHTEAFLPHPVLLRGLGAVGLVLALFGCAEAYGWAMGSVAWFGVLTAGAVAVVLVLSFAFGAPGKARPKPSVS